MLHRVSIPLTATVIAISLYSPAVAQTGTGVELSPDAPYTAERSDPIVHDVDFSIVVTPPYKCKVLKVWVPVPQSDRAQQISNSRFNTFPDEVKPQFNREPVYGNRFAYFEFHNPLGAQIIRHRFQARVWNLHWNVKPESVEEVTNWPESFAAYRQPQPLRNEDRFRNLLKEVVSERRGAGPDLARVMDWIDRNLTYDHANASLQADVDHALVERRGNCSDYHGLCATMGRALGYPAQVTYGLALFPKNSPSHCKMEAFLPPYGWVSYDLSETQKFVKIILNDKELTEAERNRLVSAANNRKSSGFRENSWLLLTRGTGYELAPKASQPVDVVRTAYVEADGEPLPEPDPANPAKREFSWMTAHRYSADKPFKLPFKDYSTLTGE